MTFKEIRLMPTCARGFGGPSHHESVLRSWHIVEKIKELLKKGCPAEVLLEIIDDLKSAQQCRYEGEVEIAQNELDRQEEVK